jgi:hypothetical protein
MQAIGNALTILGIVVTFVAYFGQHSGVSFADLEPALAARWSRVRAWLRQRLGRKVTATAVTGTAHGSLHYTATATGLVWHRIQPGDDIGVRADKLAGNLDALRANIEVMRGRDLERAREVADELRKRLDALDTVVDSRHEEGRRAATAAMRWEVRGLLITLLGAGLGIVG